MGDNTVFYSWQSDTERRTNRFFIEKALEKACRAASAQLHINLRLDQDSRGEDGSPVIPDALRRKIEAATVFVADLTIVAPRESGLGGLVNSNVGIEWGWAGQALGDSAVIGVINEAHGDASRLPVDIRQQLVSVRYRLFDGDGKDFAAEVATGVAKRLEGALVESVTARFFKAMRAEAPGIVASIMDEAGDDPGAFVYDVAELSTRAGTTKAAAEAVMHDLLLHGLAEDAAVAGSGTRIRVAEPFFAYFDCLFKNWGSDRDARELGRLLVERDEFNVLGLAAELGWTARRMNPALFRIQQYQFAEGSRTHNSAPFFAAQLRRNAATLAFAEGRLHLGPVAPRAQLRH